MSRATLIITILVAIMAGTLTGSEAIRAVVPDEVARVLAAAQAQPAPAGALAVLSAYQGHPHALVSLATGHLQMQLGDAASAEHAYRRALELDPLLHDAGIALAHQAAAREDWRSALTLLGAHCDLAGAPAPVLLLYAHAAFHAGDLRLATVIDGHGLARFPSDRAFRRFDLALLVRCDLPAQAAIAARAILALDPADGDAWRDLAWAEQAGGDQQGALAALEASWLIARDPASERRLAEAQSTQGRPQAALLHFKAIIAATDDPAALDPAMMLLAARAAADSGETAIALSWIDLVPEDRRTREARLFAARVALRVGDPKAAGVALQPLLSAADVDPAVLLWAGSIADKAGDWERAEAYFREAAALDQGRGRQRQLARLHLASLLTRHRRSEEAKAVLREQLAADPGDEPARAMLEVLERAPGDPGAR